MAEGWFTYKQLAERLNISPEAVRQKAIRHQWRRRPNNRGQAEVLVDLDEVRDAMDRNPPRKPKVEDPEQLIEFPVPQPGDARALDALDAHIATLREMIAKAEAATERERTRADDERRRALDERARADQLQERFDELQAQRMSDTRSTAERAAELEVAIGELRAALAARAARPWWKRLAG